MILPAFLSIVCPHCETPVNVSYNEVAFSGAQTSTLRTLHRFGAKVSESKIAYSYSSTLLKGMLGQRQGIRVRSVPPARPSMRLRCKMCGRIFTAKG